MSVLSDVLRLDASPTQHQVLLRITFMDLLELRTQLFAIRFTVFVLERGQAGRYLFSLAATTPPSPSSYILELSS